MVMDLVQASKVRKMSKAVDGGSLEWRASSTPWIREIDRSGQFKHACRRESRGPCRLSLGDVLALTYQSRGREQHRMPRPQEMV